MSEIKLPVFVSNIAEKLARYAAENPTATPTETAKFIVDDVDRLAVEVFQLAV